MATEESQPRNLLIFGLAVLSVASLITLKFVLDSYYHGMFDSARHEMMSVVDTHGSALKALRDRERSHLEDGPVTITAAISTFSERGTAGGRMGIADAITPVTPAQQDQGAIVGWSGFALIGAPPPAAAGAAQTTTATAPAAPASPNGAAPPAEAPAH